MKIDTKHTWLIGDTHFSHEAIIRYCGRPFKGADEMNKVLIDNWNNSVRKDDLVFMMGDFALCGKDKLIEIGNSLKGRNYLLRETTMEHH